MRGARIEAHPRSRGENEPGRVIDGRQLGSSPLTRGKLTAIAVASQEVRLIPAHAGKTCQGRRWSFQFAGSSPLTRGKPRRWNGPRGGIGLIPAHAGKTVCFEGDVRSPVAHPRSRGENGHARCRPCFRRGSSPLTRGKQPRACGPVWLVGLIPAHAGKTHRTTRPSTCGQAHPRSRGENQTVSSGPAE